jgi:hypothetical protein
MLRVASTLLFLSVIIIGTLLRLRFGSHPSSNNLVVLCIMIQIGVVAGGGGDTGGDWGTAIEWQTDLQTAFSTYDGDRSLHSAFYLPLCCDWWYTEVHQPKSQC